MHFKPCTFLTLFLATTVLTKRNDEDEKHKDSCRDQAKDLAHSANDDPQPTGELWDFLDDYRDRHWGFRDCDFTTDMPKSLTSSYDAFIATVTAWASAYESAVAEAEKTCDDFPGAHKPITGWPTKCPIHEEANSNITYTLSQGAAPRETGILLGVVAVAAGAGAAAIML
ncbi:hypothetical protein FDECE_4662 [Fusarium decemcellulare]|nr:hypothetical protein FDECE_4662 [Fusarium decemcellulare]